LYLDWLRGVAVVAMVLAHIIDSWTRDADRHGEPFYSLFFVGGVASPLFLFLAGLATAMSAASKGRRDGSPAAGAAQARRRGWEIFGLALLFRVQSQLLGMGPLTNLLKVDMLNTMGLSIVAASYVWQLGATHRIRVALLALITGAIAMATPLIRATPALAPLPDAVEAYLRPAATYAAFPLFPWAGFLFAGVIVGALIDAVRTSPHRQRLLQAGIACIAVAGVWLSWRASFLPSIYERASFWHDSPTFFFIRLGLVAVLVPTSWAVERTMPSPLLQPIVTLGRSSLFVYWIHVEMVYGVIAEPLKRQVPLWGALAGAAALTLVLYLLVLLKNRLRERYELRGAFRLLAPVIR
jgi:acyltransferase